jgi:hypothetical protein
MIPSVVQLNQHVRVSGIVTDVSHKAALGCFGTYESIQTYWCIAIFDCYTGSAGKGVISTNDYEQHYGDVPQSGTHDRPLRRVFFLLAFAFFLLAFAFVIRDGALKIIVF